MFCLTICPPSSSISHAYLLPFLHLCHIHFLSQPSLLTKMQSLSGSFNPKHSLYLLSAYLYLCTALLLSQSFTLSTSLTLSPTFSPHSASLSPSLSFPSQQLHCPWVGANNVGPHGALRSPSREGRELQRTPITQCFKLGCGIKGSLTHGWLCGSALDHLWRRRAATGTRIPHWECVYMCVRTSVSCPLQSLVVRAPLQFIPGSYSMGNLPPPPSLPSSFPSLYTHAAMMSLWAPWTKQGALWGHQLVLPHGATWPMNGETPKPSTV